MINPFTLLVLLNSDVNSLVHAVTVLFVHSSSSFLAIAREATGSPTRHEEKCQGGGKSNITSVPSPFFFGNDTKKMS